MRYIPVGRVLATHGKRGEIKLHYYNEVKQEFYRYTFFVVKNGDTIIELMPTGVRLSRGFFYIHFEGFNDEKVASFLVGKEISVREKDISPLKEGEYYDYQLIGLDVFNQQHMKVGTVKEIVHTKANDVLIVSGKEEILIPMIEDYIIHIDLGKSSVLINDALLTS